MTNLPALPGWSAVALGPTLVLEAGKQYAARLQLSSGDSFFASPELVAEKLTPSGYTWSKLGVWKRLSELPATWPASREDGPGRWWAMGTPKQKISIPRPEQVEALWVKR